MEQQINSNRQLVLSAFEKGEVREDHYDGNHILYEFSAILPVPSHSIGERRKLIRWLLLFTQLLPIRPSSIFIDKSFLPGSKIELEFCWQYQHAIALRSKEDYLDLALEFADHLDNLQIPDLAVNTGSFGDDPAELKQGRNVEHHGHFNEYYFGSAPIAMQIYDQYGGIVTPAMESEFNLNGKELQELNF